MGKTKKRVLEDVVRLVTITSREESKEQTCLEKRAYCHTATEAASDRQDT